MAGKIVRPLERQPQLAGRSLGRRLSWIGAADQMIQGELKVSGTINMDYHVDHGDRRCGVRVEFGDPPGRQ